MMKKLEHSFNTKNFEAFIKVVSKLAEEASSQNSKAMQLLTYLKQQSRSAYRDVVCDPSKLSGDGWFTVEDFEILVNLYLEQKAAKKEESIEFPFLT